MGLLRQHEPVLLHLLCLNLLQRPALAITLLSYKLYPALHTVHTRRKRQNYRRTIDLFWSQMWSAVDVMSLRKL